MTVFSELRMRPATATRWGWDASTTSRLAMAGVVIFTLLVGANLATPLYPLLQVRLGISSLGITVAFSAYVLALVATLMLAGHWSDHIGRRAALLLAVLTGLAGGLLFANADSLAGLCGGRALQGVAVALATGASSAALRELLPERPEWASRFTLLASAGGVAAGPAIGGILSLLPGATTTPYLIHSLVLAALLIPLYLLRARPAIKPAAGPRPLKALAPRRPTVSREARGAFWLAAAVGFLSFAVFGFCLSLAPSYFAKILGTDSRPLIGLLAGLTLGASALSQLVAVRSRFAVPAGLAVLSGAVALLAAAAAAGNPWLLVAASVAAGAGQGVAFRTVFNDVAGKVEASRHAQIVSTVYVITYLGSAVPVVGLGLATASYGLDAAVAAFVTACACAAGLLAAITLRRSLRQ
ncbi:MFS transporter [Arthrobacter sp. FW305-BF8]|uniref:MFS transporter n=1 Tax=Arthrobacter sp. FW305-BF8 TaxID=2879617 RepID=UPI001F00033D|nr:MFS transporter [Arthrobacter sp. FW305-BF8]UKA53097.1 MFS transporter [Arthrobacter sp. FW305-BF8]